MQFQNTLIIQITGISLKLDRKSRQSIAIEAAIIVNALMGALPNGFYIITYDDRDRDLSAGVIWTVPDSSKTEKFPFFVSRRTSFLMN